MDCDYKRLIQYANNDFKVAVVGSGSDAARLIRRLRGEGILASAVFDNHPEKEGKVLCGIPISRPLRMDEDAIYVIATSFRSMARSTLRDQLIAMGISEDLILDYSNYSFLMSLEDHEYKNEIQVLYEEKHGKKLNWDHPTTYSEIVNIEKAQGVDPLKKRCADKIAVRGYVKEKIGEQYLTQLIKVYEDPSEIDFDMLPDAFALKMNHGSGMNIIVKDKTTIDIEETRKKLNDWKHVNHAFLVGLEIQYRDIEPRIICEEYLEGVAETVYDYDVFCFHGEPVYVWCIKGSHRPECKASFYNLEWEKQPFSYGYPEDPIVAPRPPHLEKMIELSKELSKDFRHVRVDWQIMPSGRIVFSELTFTTWSGLRSFSSEDWDREFGRLILNRPINK